MGEWYCPACKVFISAETVTSAEVHDLCNTPVVWIEDVQGKEELYNAAPEMYKALKKALPFIAHFRSGWSTHPPADISSELLAQQLEAAIAKAEGYTC